MIPPVWVQLRHSSGGYLLRIGPYQHVESWAIVDDPRKGGFFEREDAAVFCDAKQAPIDWDQFELVPGIACGCCGKFSSYGGHPMNSDFRQVTPDHWRCEKHVGRLPCIIEGCGRTFAMKPEDSYYTRSVCGRHWRQAPLRIRKHCAAIGKKARKYGWTDRLIALHNSAWERAIRTIQHGHQLDMHEINRLFGWDDSATTKD